MLRRLTLSGRAEHPEFGPGASDKALLARCGMKKRAALMFVIFCVMALPIAPLATAQSANPPKQQASSGPSAKAATDIGPLIVKQQPQQTATPSVEKKSPPAANTDSNSSKYIQVPVGTVLPLVLHNAISTRNAKAGDPVFLETLFPILVGPKIVIPAGSYVSGEVTEAKRAGRGHGRAEIRVRLDNLILPNGYEAQFNAVPRNAGTGGNESVGKEGTIKGDSNKAGNVDTVAETTLAGAGIGSAVGAAAGNLGRGAGLGLGVGAAAGLLEVLLTRGPEAELPRGTTLDVSLNRPLYLLSAKINFTSPGQASALPGPPNREPRRSTGIIPHWF